MLFGVTLYSESGRQRYANMESYYSSAVIKYANNV